MKHIQLIGKPWVANTSGPDSFDCWGLVCYWYEAELGIKLPDTPVSAIDLVLVAKEMQSAIKSSLWEEETTWEDNQVVAMGRNKIITHVGVHMAGGYVLHCSREAGGVTVQTISQLQRKWRTLKTYKYIG